MLIGVARRTPARSDWCTAIGLWMPPGILEPKAENLLSFNAPRFDMRTSDPPSQMAEVAYRLCSGSVVQAPIALHQNVFGSRHVVEQRLKSSIRPSRHRTSFRGLATASKVVTSGRRPLDSKIVPMHRTSPIASRPIEPQTISGPFLTFRSRRVWKMRLSPTQSIWRTPSGRCGWRPCIHIQEILCRPGK